MIPKKIHYCWFGGNPLPDDVKRYIESWKKYCPDYEIVQWNESNYDVHKNPYVEQCYNNKKWAFFDGLCSIGCCISARRNISGCGCGTDSPAG